MNENSSEKLQSSLSVYARFLFKESEKPIFSDACCAILVSVGQIAHEGAKFEATIDIVNRKFKSCVIAICDTLQRHNLILEENISENEARRISKEMGTQWYTRNKKIIESLNIPYQVRYWDRWLKHSEFNSHHQILKNLLVSDNAFGAAMIRTAKDFVNRFQNRSNKNIDSQRILDKSIEYLSEECAIIMRMWLSEGINYIVYPSEILEVMKFSYNKFVAEAHDDLLKWVRVRLKTRKLKEKEVI